MAVVVCPNAACGLRIPIPAGTEKGVVRCSLCGRSVSFVTRRRTLLDAAKKPAAPAAAPPRTTTIAAAGPRKRVTVASMAGRPPASPEVFPSIGRFQIRGRLGAGAMGAVYRALDPQLEREVALKVPHTLEGTEARERFLREARAAGRLRHPCIVPVHEAGAAGQQYYIASAFIAGQPLADAIEGKPIEFRRSARIVRQLAEALAYAHSLGIVHRDVKPANILLDEKDQPHLTDFGLAHLQDGAEKLTREGAVLGTPAYMSPEQASGKRGKPLPASDQYSLGVVLYELLCGQVPFSGPVPVVILKVQQELPPSPRKVRPSVPRDLEQICLKALAKKPSERYATCQELADDLRRWLEGEPVWARRPGVAERMVRWCRREPVLAACGSLVTACLVGVTVVTMLGAMQLAASAQVEADAHAEADRAREAELEAADRAEVAYQAEVEAHAREQQQLERLNEALARAEKARGTAAEARKTAEEQRKEAEAALTRAEKAQRAADEATKTADQRGTELENVVDKVGRFTFHHKGAVTALAFRPDSLVLTSASGDGIIKNWDLQSGKELQGPRTSRGLTACLCYRPDGGLLASGADQGGAINPIGRISLWVPRGDHRFLTGHVRGSIKGLAFHPQGATLGSAGMDGTVRLWDIENGKELRTLKSGGAKPILALTFTRDGNSLLSSDLDNRVTVWDATTGKERHSFGLARSTGRVFLDTEGRRYANLGTKPLVTLWSVTVPETGPTRKLLGVIDDYPGEIGCIAFSPVTDEYVAVGDGDGAVKIWHIDRKKVMHTFHGHVGAVRHLLFSSDGKHLASGAVDRTVKVWKLNAAQP